MEEQPFDRIEVRDDGYLWLVNYKEETSTANNSNDNGNDHIQQQQPLLLHSTFQLLKQLREKWHDGSAELVHVAANTYEDDKEEEEQQEIQSKSGNDEEHEEQPPEGFESKDDEEKEENDNFSQDENDNGKETKEEGEDDDSEASSASAESSKNGADADNEAAKLLRYKQLLRETNLSDRIMNAMTHIQIFRHETRKRKRNKDGQRPRESKVKALEHQRERLLQQKREQEAAASAGGSQTTDVINNKSNNHPEEEDDQDFEVVGKKPNNQNNNNKGDEGDDDDSVARALQPPQNPHVRLVRTLNSFRALVPVLRSMLFHEDRERRDLSMGRKKTQLPKKGKASCWLIGNHVFDVTTVSNCHKLQLHLLELLECYLPYQTVADIMDGLLADEEQFWNQEWLTFVWVPPTHQPYTQSISLASPITILNEIVQKENGESNEAKARSIEDTCHSLDKKFFVQERSKKDAQKAAADQKKYSNAVNRLHNRIEHLLTKDFRGSRLSVYGSCLSNLSLKASDVDLSLYLPEAERIKKAFENGHSSWSPARYEKEMAKLVREVWRKLMYRKSEFADMVAVTRARVPVVKGCYLKANNPHTADGSLHFDICFLNDIAVANSSLLREYSLMDESVRELMIVVKKWAKENEICSAQDNTPSSYAWMNLVIFYLQCIEYVPNLQCPKLMKKFGLQRSPNEYWHNVNNLDTCYLTLDQALQVWKRPENLVKTPISATALLYGFFNFYAVEFMGAVSMISIKRGREEILPKTVFRKCSPFFCIEDPFETFDSHCPHDLGIPVNEKQTMRIFYLLEQAEEHLRKALLGVDGIALDDVLSLWPSKEQIEEGAAKKARARSQGGDGSKKKKKKKKGKRNRGQQQKKQPKGQKEGGATGKVQNKQQTKPQEAPKTKQEGKGKKQQQHHKKEKDTPNNDKQQGKDAVNNHQKRGGGPKKANKPQNQGTGAKTTENSKSNNKKNGAGVNTAKADGGSNNHAKNGEDKNKAKAGGISQKNRRLGKKKSQEGPRQQQQSLNAKPKSHHPKE